MSEPELPNPIDEERINLDILEKLVHEHNSLLEYVAFQNGQRWDGWDWVLINPAPKEIKE